MIEHLETNEAEVYGRLAVAGTRLRDGLARISESSGFPVHVLGATPAGFPKSSLVYMHPALGGSASPTCPEELVERGNPRIPERLLKATLLLCDLSTRSGIGGVTMAHTDDDLARTLERVSDGFDRFVRAGLAGG
jgi:glutamate-1-semialdehyde aminotransferase